jgi:hypothetical protein
MKRIVMLLVVLAFASPVLAQGLDGDPPPIAEASTRSTGRSKNRFNRTLPRCRG